MGVNDFTASSSQELQEWVFHFSNADWVDGYPGKFDLSGLCFVYIPNFPLRLLWDHEPQNWLDWMELEKGYGDGEHFQNLQRDWMPHQDQEPIVLGVASDGFVHVIDGCHRIALLYSLEQSHVPAIVGLLAK